ncbi:MAG: prolipoprotein diacylglyceryl transferase [Actinomycetia bacterium]|nr:prolipoprotein diacylglyceryl transferase [Actinomycetes bacterium]
MPLAYIPSPARSVWHLGPMPLRAQALCVVAGILLAIYVADRRYRATGGPRGVIMDVAAWAVPAGLVPAIFGALLARAQPGALQDLRTWDQVAGFPAAVACGAAGAWLGCLTMRGLAARVTGTAAIGPAGAARPGHVTGGVPGAAAGTAASRTRGRGAPIRRAARLKVGPVAGAAAPALLLGHALAMAGEWFTQRGYGRPSSLWWAVEIAPAHRVPGLENFATFQPVFAYQALWDVAAGMALIYVAHRFTLSGGQAFALACAAYAAGGFPLFWLGNAHSPGVLGFSASTLGYAALLIAAGTCFVRLRRGHIASSQPAGGVPLERSRPLM